MLCFFLTYFYIQAALFSSFFPHGSVCAVCKSEKMVHAVLYCSVFLFLLKAELSLSSLPSLQHVALSWSIPALSQIINLKLIYFCTKKGQTIEKAVVIKTLQRGS